MSQGSWKDPPLMEAWADTFRSANGPALAESLRRVAAEIGPLESSALQAHNGRRSFATELLRIAAGREQAFVHNEDKAKPSKGRMKGRRVGPEA